ncbi:MAG TPA: amidase family protein, partial [Verrucomicrobiae bacterium]|nr:amidase family protein [Verrucomicrobiae bacterium]
LKVAIWAEPSCALDAPVANALAAFQADLDRAGAIVRSVASPVDARQLMFAYTMLLFSLMSSDMPASARGFFELLRGPALVARGLGAEPLSWAQGVIAYTARHRDWLAADEVRAKLSRQMEAVFDEHDVLIAPISPVVAFPHDHRPISARRLTTSEGGALSYLKLFEWISLATLCGLPATAIPIAASGLPIGLQIIGRRGDDSKTLAVAAAIEREFGGFRPPPAA